MIEMRMKILRYGAWLRLEEEPPSGESKTKIWNEINAQNTSRTVEIRWGHKPVRFVTEINFKSEKILSPRLHEVGRVARGFVSQFVVISWRRLVCSVVSLESIQVLTLTSYLNVYMCYWNSLYLAGYSRSVVELWKENTTVAPAHIVGRFYSVPGSPCFLSFRRIEKFAQCSGTMEHCLTIISKACKTEISRGMADWNQEFCLLGLPGQPDASLVPIAALFRMVFSTRIDRVYWRTGNMRH